MKVSLARALLRPLLMVLLCDIAAAQQAQKGKPEFSISISAPESLKVGSRMMIGITVSNTSGRAITFDGDDLYRGERNFNVEMLDSAGAFPPETRYLKAIKGEDQGPGPTRLVVNGKYFQRDLKPGESLKGELNLTELYDLKAGSYTVTLWRPDFQDDHVRQGPPREGAGKAQSERSGGNAEPPHVIPAKAIARSNTITINITQ